MEDAEVEPTDSADDDDCDEPRFLLPETAAVGRRSLWLLLSDSSDSSKSKSSS